MITTLFSVHYEQEMHETDFNMSEFSNFTTGLI